MKITNEHVECLKHLIDLVDDEWGDVEDTAYDLLEELKEEAKRQEQPRNVFLDEADLDKLEDILDNITYARESHCIYADGCIYLSDILRAADFIREHGKTKEKNENNPITIR